MNDSEENESVSRDSPLRPCFGAESEMGSIPCAKAIVKLVIVTLLAKLLLMERP
jgi:hypothetical protein